VMLYTSTADAWLGELENLPWCTHGRNRGTWNEGLGGAGSVGETVGISPGNHR
jgi:hypothetical protein